jgi:hypothetical protein
MFPGGLNPTDGSQLRRERRHWRKRQPAAGGMPRRRVVHRFHPGDYNQGFELLETRQLLSSDLTHDIVNLLDGGTTTGSATFDDVTLGSDLSSSSVTVSFQNISQSGSDFTGTISVTANSASLAIGSAVSAQISGANGSPGITGSYTLADQPADQGAYQLSVSQFDLTLSKLLTAQASDVTIDYSPTAAAGQELVQVGSLSATLLPFDNATVTVGDLDIFDNGFTLGDATIPAPSMTLGQVLTIDQPALKLSGVGYTAGAFTGTIGLSANTASLFPGQSAFSATVDNPGGSYSVANQTLTLSAGDLDLSIGHVLQATGSKLSFSLNDSQSPPAATFDAQQITLTSPDFPNATGTIADFSGTNTGFTIGSATLTDSSAVTFGKILEFSSPSLSLTNFGYTPGAAPAVTGTFTVGGTIELFPGQSSFSSTVDGFSASYDIASETFNLQASAIELNLGQVLTAKTGPVNFTVDDSSGSPAVSFDVQNVALSSSDFPDATGTLGDLSANSAGFTIDSASLGYAGAISLGGVLSVTGLSLGVENFAYTTGTDGGAATVGGTITFGAQSVSLFAGQSAFTTTISDPTGQSPSGLSGSYDIDTQAIDFQLDQVEIQVSDLVDVTADNVSVDVTPGSFGMTVGSATASVPKLAGFQGSVQKLAITSDGFTIGSATLGFAGTLSLGSVLTISNPSATISGLSYSIESGAQFNGDVSFGLSANLNVGKVASAAVSGLNVTLGLTPEDFGQFSVTANSASFTL